MKVQLAVVSHAHETRLACHRPTSAQQLSHAVREGSAHAWHRRVVDAEQSSLRMSVRAPRDAGA